MARSSRVRRSPTTTPRTRRSRTRSTPQVNGIAVSDHDPSLMNKTLAGGPAGHPGRAAERRLRQRRHRRDRRDDVRRPAGDARRPGRRAALRQARRDERPLRDPPVRPEPARPLQRPRAGSRRRLAVQDRQPAGEGPGLHRADPVDAERRLEPAAGDRAGDRLPPGAPGDQGRDDAEHRDRHGARHRHTRR